MKTKNELIEKNRLRVLRQALRENLMAGFGRKRPADRSLSQFWRENRGCGSTDRARIGEIIYAVWRNWGRLRQLINPERLGIVEAGELVWAEELDLLIDGANKYLEKPESAVLPEWVSSEVNGNFPLDEYSRMVGTRPPMFVRLQSDDANACENAVKELKSAGLRVEKVKNLPDALAIFGRVNLFTLDGYRAGVYEVQDLASQLIGIVAAPKKGERWWDCCAGAGGKSLHLAQLMERKGELVASDIRAYKLDDLRKRSRRAGFPNIRTKSWDGKTPTAKKQLKYHGVLVDAPCSCSGVWRRNPDGVWTTSQEEIAEMAQMQQAILQAASAGVKHEGTLIYATCSIFRRENEEVVEQFLAANADFYLEEFINPLDQKSYPGMLNILPGTGNSDSMFVARMRKK